MILEAGFPIIDGFARNRERCGYNLTRPARAAPSTWPREKGNDGSGRADTIPEIEMIASRIVEIDGAFHQSQAEYLRVKIEIALRIGCDGGDVMDAKKFHATVDSIIGNPLSVGR
jgi:hypothetical protein